MADNASCGYWGQLQKITILYYTGSGVLSDQKPSVQEEVLLWSVSSWLAANCSRSSSIYWTILSSRALPFLSLFLHRSIFRQFCCTLDCSVLPLNGLRTLGCFLTSVASPPTFPGPLPSLSQQLLRSAVPSQTSGVRPPTPLVTF